MFLTVRRYSNARGRWTNTPAAVGLGEKNIGGGKTCVVQCMFFNFARNYNWYWYRYFPSLPGSIPEGTDSRSVNFFCSFIRSFVPFLVLSGSGACRFLLLLERWYFPSAWLAATMVNYRKSFFLVVCQKTFAYASNNQRSLVVIRYLLRALILAKYRKKYEYVHTHTHTENRSNSPTHSLRQ